MSSRPLSRRTALLLLAASAAVGPSASRAQPGRTSPVGLWRTVDDRTGQQKALVRIFESNGALYGRVEQIFDPEKSKLTCVKCTDDRHDKPLLGLDFLRGLKPDGDGGWTGGEILDPETGSVYHASAHLADDGRKLVVRGYLLMSMLGRSQTWLREN